MSDDYTAVVYNAVRTSNVLSLNQFLDSLEPTEQRAVIECPLEGQTVINLEQKHINGINWLKLLALHRVEQLSLRPLWLAVYLGSQDMVELLLSFGADVNEPKKCGRRKTAAATACRVGSYDMLYLLLENGNPMSKENFTDCLFLCMQYNEFDMMELLISRGADVNDVVYKGDESLLHYAIRCVCDDESECDVEVVELLLDNGADLDAVNCHGETPLRAAVLLSCHDVAKMLIDKYEFDPQETAEAYELTGAVSVLVEDSLVRARPAWNAAMKLRTSVAPLPADYTPRQTRMYGLMTEPRNADELADLMTSLYDSSQYALVLLERILGPSSESAKIIRRDYSWVNASRGEYERSIDLSLVNVVNYTRDKASSLPSLVQRLPNSQGQYIFLEDYCNYDFYQISYSQSALIGSTQLLDEAVTNEWIEDVLNVLGWVVEEIKLSTAVLQDKTVVTDNGAAIQNLMLNVFTNNLAGYVDRYRATFVRNAVKLVIFLQKLHVKDESLHRLQRLMHSLVQSFSLRGPERMQRTLLNTVIEQGTNIDTFSYTNICQLILKHGGVAPNSPYLNVRKAVNLFLHCGADARELDSRGNSPLHVIGRQLGQLHIEFNSRLRDDHSKEVFQREMGEIEQAAQLLIQHGAHADVRNRGGERASDMLTRFLPSFQTFKHMTLQCHSARVLRSRGYPLSMIPRHLREFVLMH